MSANPDLLLYDRENRLVTAVEIRARRGTTRDWAAQLRRNLLQHEGFRGARFFLVVTLDRIYLWPRADAAPDLTPPAYEVEAEPVLRPYLAGTRLDLEALSGPAFEMLVSTWLNELVRSDGSAQHSRGWLEESGLLAAIRHGRLDYQVAA